MAPNSSSISSGWNVFWFNDRRDRGFASTGFCLLVPGTCLRGDDWRKEASVDTWLERDQGGLNHWDYLRSPFFRVPSLPFCQSILPGGHGP